MGEKLSELSEEDHRYLDALRDWARNHFEEDRRQAYETVDGKLAVVDAILANNWVNAEEDLKLQRLVVTFGDALAQKIGLTWVVVEDALGRSPALRLQKTSFGIFPLQMIQ
jgi:hypothetical protein